MAKQIQVSQDLKNTYVKKRNTSLLMLLCTVIFLYGGLFFHILWIVSAIFLVVGVKKWNQSKIVKVGWIGEKSTNKILKDLSNEFVILSNLKISFDGKQSEMDKVVIGPTGVFVIEVKNYSGEIIGNSSDRQWRQIKKKYGSKSFYNPAKQVGTHVYRLSHWLKSKGIFVWVQPIVFFCNPNTRGMISGEGTPVFFAEQGVNTLLNYIQNHVPNKPVNVNQIFQLINHETNHRL